MDIYNIINNIYTAFWYYISMQNLEYIWKTLERLKNDDRKLPEIF